MTTTLDEISTSKPVKTAKFRGALRGTANATSSTAPRRTPVIVWSVTLRGLVLLADYFIAIATATVVIPLMAQWLHQMSGVANGELNSNGVVALWLFPLGFLVILLAAAEIALMRGLWRATTGRIEKIRAARTPLPAQPEETADRPSKKNHKRSK